MSVGGGSRGLGRSRKESEGRETAEGSEKVRKLLRLGQEGTSGPEASLWRHLVGKPLWSYCRPSPPKGNG